MGVYFLKSTFKINLRKTLSANLVGQRRTLPYFAIPNQCWYKLVTVNSKGQVLKSEQINNNRTLKV